MKKFVVLWLLVIMLVQVFFVSNVLAEGDTRCVKCDRVVDSKYCPDCGEEIAKQKPAFGDNEGILTLNISCAKNKILAKRDVDVYIDGKKVATIPHGESFRNMFTLERGLHTLKFCASDNDKHFVEDVVDVWLDTDYTCTLKMHCFSVEIKQIQTDGFVSAERKELHYKEVFCTACQTVNYETYARYPSQYKEKNIQISGKIIGIANSRSATTIIIEDKDGNEWLVSSTLLSDEPRLMVNDHLTVYGVALGVEAYTYANCYSHLLPAIQLKYHTAMN